MGASRFEGAGAVDAVGGVADFFVDGKLGGKAAAGLELAHAAGKEAFELLIRGAEGDDKSIEVFGEAGFDEESSFDEGGVANART